MSRSLYHVAPASARASILAHGLDGRRAAGQRWRRGESGFYAFLDRREAEFYAQIMADETPRCNMDLWEARGAGQTRPDSGLSSCDEPTSAVYHADPVGPQHLRLAASRRPGQPLF